MPGTPGKPPDRPLVQTGSFFLDRACRCSSKKGIGIQEVKDSMDAVSVVSVVFTIGGGALVALSVVGMGIGALLLFLQ